jgi:hypothetical protein
MWLRIIAYDAKRVLPHQIAKGPGRSIEERLEDLAESKAKSSSTRQGDESVWVEGRMDVLDRTLSHSPSPPALESSTHGPSTHLLYRVSFQVLVMS